MDRQIRSARNVYLWLLFLPLLITFTLFRLQPFPDSNRPFENIVLKPLMPMTFPVDSVSISPENVAILFAGRNQEIYKSIDGGQRWQSILMDAPWEDLVHLHAASTDVLYALADQAVFQSPDGGHTWQYLEIDGSVIEKITPDPQSLDTLYAVAVDGLLSTRDGGQSWEKIPPPRNDSGILAVSRTNPGTLFAVSLEGLHRSNDDGRTWGPAEDRYGNFFDVGMPEDREPGIFYAMTSSGVYETTNGGSHWRSIQTLPDGRYLSLERDTYYALADGDLYEKPFLEGEWCSVSSDECSPTRITSLFVSPQSPAQLIGLTDFDAAPVYSSQDGGSTWQPAHHGLPCKVNDLAINPENSNIIIAAVDFSWGNCDDVYITRDGGARWTAANEQDTKSFDFITFDPLQADTLFAHTEDLYTSTDMGQTWSPIFESNWHGYINNFILDYGNPGTLYLATKGGVLKSTSTGDDWNAINFGLSNIPISIVMTLAASLWYVVLVFPAFNRKSNFILWHGRQAILLAAILTAMRLAFLYAAGSFPFTPWLPFTVLTGVWVSTSWWGARQASHGECTLMRLNGRGESLPLRSEDADDSDSESSQEPEPTFAPRKDIDMSNYPRRPTDPLISGIISFFLGPISFASIEVFFEIGNFFGFDGLMLWGPVLLFLAGVSFSAGLGVLGLRNSPRAADPDKARRYAKIGLTLTALSLWCPLAIMGSFLILPCGIFGC